MAKPTKTPKTDYGINDPHGAGDAQHGASTMAFVDLDKTLAPPAANDPNPYRKAKG
jgi:hypothetical protein